MLIVVLHQTISNSVDFLQSISTAPYSYHCFINKQGTITYLVPATRQANACNNCQIKGIDSVDKYAYQICFESIDGSLTNLQYMSLAYVLSLLDVEVSQVYNHSNIAPSNDLKLLDKNKLVKSYNKFIPNKTIYTGLE